MITVVLVLCAVLKKRNQPTVVLVVLMRETVLLSLAGPFTNEFIVVELLNYISVN